MPGDSLSSNILMQDWSSGRLQAHQAFQRRLFLLDGLAEECGNITAPPVFLPPGPIDNKSLFKIKIIVIDGVRRVKVDVLSPPLEVLEPEELRRYHASHLMKRFSQSLSCLRHDRSQTF